MRLSYKESIARIEKQLEDLRSILFRKSCPGCGEGGRRIRKEPRKYSLRASCKQCNTNEIVRYDGYVLDSWKDWKAPDFNTEVDL